MAESLTGIPAPGVGLPVDARIGKVKLQVADLNRSADYYIKVLGMVVVDQTPTSVSLAPQGGEPTLVELHEYPGANPVPRSGRLGLYHFAILLPNREALGSFLEHLSDLGIRAGMADHAVSEAVYLTDPDGLGIEVYADRPRREWRYEGRQLYMTTERLDAAGLVTAARAAGVSWRGMPAGTVMGHIHLHVGDLDRAIHIYHDQLGFDQTVWSYPGAVFMSAGGYHHHLAVNTWAAGAPAAARDEAQLLEWELIVPDVSTIEGIASRMAGQVIVRVANEIVLEDPWGTRVRVCIRS